MSLTALFTRSVTIVRRSDTGAIDEYGGDIPTETLVDVLGEIQQTRRSEPGAEGELSDAEWTLFLPTGTEIRTGDSVIYGGHVFEVAGQPWDATTGSASMHHVEATLRRTAGAGDEEAGS